MSNPKTVDSSLWFDSFTTILTDLENAPLSSDLPPNLAKKLKENHAWFVETVSLFKKPNAKSREALNSEIIKIGSHEVTVKPELKVKALHISSYLCLDEVQSYILVERSLECDDLAVDSTVEDCLHVVLLQFYIERQCLLKCTRRILMHALCVGICSKEENVAWDEASKLISDGLEQKLISVLQDLLSSSHPDQMDVDLFTLWAEETLIEDNLVLDILFLLYYESLCTCNGEKWKRLCLLYKGILSGSYNFGKLAISAEAVKSSYHASIQLLLILIDTLDLENLLLLVHDGVPFRKGASVFSVTDIQQMDVLISSFVTLGTRESGPLILAWAVCLCLIASLPGSEENNVLMEIDHVGYVRQSFEGAPLNIFVNILESDLLKESDGPVAGYQSVLRTFISAFIASYEINLQLEDSTLSLILDILCKIYRGEESLCIQFWDKKSFIDGPIRCLLCNLEGVFPFRTAEFVRLLSALCEGSWPAECVYNFLDKYVGVSTLFEITSESLVDRASQVVETQLSLQVPGADSLIIPSKTRGHVLKFIDGNTALVRWEYEQSGVLVLLLRLVNELYLESNEEVFLTFDLLSRLVSFNTAITFTLMEIGNTFYLQAAGVNEQMEKKFWVVEVICAVIKKSSPNSGNAAVMSMGVSILASMLTCAPSHIAAVVLKANIFDAAWKTSVFEVGCDGPSSGSWLLSGKLVKMLLIDSEQNDYDKPLTISVLDFTMQLVEARLENDLVLALVIFSLQYILVNHEYWKYKVKHVRWKVTLKVLEVMKACITSVSFSEKLALVIRDMLLNDSSIHNALFHLACTTKQTLENLYVSRLVELEEIEGCQLAVSSALDIIYTMLSKFCKDIPPTLPVLHLSVLSSTMKPIPVVAAAISLISYSRSPAVQVGAAKVLSMLFTTADYMQPYLSGNVCFGLDDKQIADMRHFVKSTLVKQLEWNEDYFVAAVNLLTNAARFQPAYLLAIFSVKEDTEVHLSNAGGTKQPINEPSNGSMYSKKSSLLDELMQYVERSNEFIDSNPRILLTVLDFLKALWQGAVHYISILECLKSSGKFWKLLSNCISSDARLIASPFENLTATQSQSLALKYQCQSAILEIMAHDMFLMKKLLHAESVLKEVSELKERNEKASSMEKLKSVNDCELKDILSSWWKRPIFGNLINLYASCEYDNEISNRLKVAASLFIVHAMGKLVIGNAGSLSVSLVEKIQITFKHLSCQLAFSELLTQYSQRGYSEGKELKGLILNDLYHHLQGELEGRKIGPGPFKELSQYLVESICFLSYQHKYGGDHYGNSMDIHLYDLMRIQSDLGLNMWDYTDWKDSKAIGQTMLECFQDANSMVLLASSKLSALKALLTALTMWEDNSTENKGTTEGNIPRQLCFSCIDNLCKSFHTTVESLAPFLDASEEILDFLSALAELILHLMKSAQSNLSLSVCVLVLKTSGSGLKLLNDFRSSATGVKKTMKLLLMLLLFALEISNTSDKESEDFAEVSNGCLGLLPILCNCITATEHCSLSLATIDLVLTSFLTPNTWFPIIQKHLQLPHVILKVHDKSSFSSVPITLKFLLTLARARGGAEMLLSAGFFSSLRALFADSPDVGSTVMTNDSGSLKSSDKIEKPQSIWGLGLAVIVAMVQSLGDSSSYNDLLDNVIPYVFSEKADLISYYLSAPDFPSESHDKKRPRAKKTETSLGALKETQHTLMLMCALARHWRSWVKVMKEMDSELREKSIHLLAFISRGTHRFGESSSRTAPLLFAPILKEELECCKKPSFLNSRNGWFALSPLCCVSKPKSSAFSANSSAIAVKGQSTEITNPVSPTYFSDLVALEIYRIAFLLLKYLSIEAEGAAKRSEEVGFVDLAQIPELPMPELLHGLQDQAVAIVSELCGSSKSKDMNPEIKSVCLLLLQIMEMALYLELYVLQICGIRPVLGRVEDFSKELKLLLKAMEGHTFMKASVTSLKHIISLVYPGLLQGFL
ncbi:NUCLEOPORIN NUP188-like protein [Salix viminalis]|uniref:NUCLEOPORIN NUP188-like protein n=1 Tax=Salix viminalis TaxID=40686 RepID=A0A9Q0NKI5_SALVM|nr:NUCLEOPORIN NUP188-like protein [Salix viminalis]